MNIFFWSSYVFIFLWVGYLTVHFYYNHKDKKEENKKFREWLMTANKVTITADPNVKDNNVYMYLPKTENSTYPLE